ncbi:MFS general substrate transporter [Hortaea werneckii]|uniref:Major facilitator superfamily (MFS) profile domain-containing protein n=1 Tax=Hortaea werneckii TaxID=91943 RepID=A0A3M7B0R8_HORWE|nr:MFS general substrate transporter [Hortaea werneckii]KAI7010810.1 MFS general substrate transporter [Hortaea werneckii]KAI7667166.1 MFS general substrate transporter [Hortaea werneckii]RMY15423.1 hypothetical protein D0867_06836 [Hortaea werneckii]RMY33321.1 hypothetical protein D0866_06008 [Hortaea werneckii]
MSDSSFDDVEKGASSGRPSKEGHQTHLTQEQEDFHEAAEPPFTVADELQQPHDANHGAPLGPVASEKPSINNIKAVPNGGLKAWLQVVGAFFLFWNTWGIINTFGTYQTYYETGILASSSPSDISWIGSVQAFLLMLVGAVTGPVYDAGYFRHLLIGGSLLAVFGQMMLSLCTEYWQVFLAQGLCIGLGSGCLFVPAVAILSTYFSTKIATATGLAAAGSSLGGVVYPIVFHRLQPTIGFPWATRVLGFMMLATLGVSNAVMRVRVLPAGRRKFLDLSAFKEAPYVLFVAGGFLAFMGLYAPFFYVQSYSIETGIAGARLSFYLLSIINATSTFGRIIPGYVGDYIGPLNMIVPCAMVAGIVCLCFMAAHSVAGVILACAFYGFFSGTLVSMPPTIFVHLTKNRAVIGTRMGMGFAIISIGLLIGTPIDGAILNSSGEYQYVWLFGGLLTICGTLCMLGTRITKGGFSLLKRV